MASPPPAGAVLKLELRPLDHDPRDLGVRDGSRIWGALSCDPAFIATAPGGDPLAPGWYSASAILDGRSGDIDRPCLYIPDAAGGYSERLAIPMARRGAAYAAEFCIPHAVPHLRLDPSRYPCEFACETLELEPIAPRRRSVRDALRAVAARRAVQLPMQWGRTLLRLALTPRGVPQTAARHRKQHVLAAIDRSGLGIEIGPSHDPIAPKREGFNVHVIDHASREELLEKYKAHPIAHEKIEEVDFIWRGQGYAELTGRPGQYDWIIASHLLEHTPDLIAFLADCDSLLKDGGVLSLVIPDKRYCFDRFRPITGLARVIDSHLAGNRIHSAGTAAEYYLNVAGKDHRLGWDAATPGEYVFVHSASHTREKMREVREAGAYLDIHNWCFVPHSFRLLVNDLYALGYTRLREVKFHPTVESEFYVTLGRHGAGPDMSRLELLRAIDAELAETDVPPARRRLLRRLLRP